MLCRSFNNLRHTFFHLNTLNGLHSTVRMINDTNSVNVENSNGREDVYDKALEHWTSVASDVDGMLGGFAQLHSPDISGSRQFLSHLRNSGSLLGNERALDCGCGIGRVAKHLLLPAFKSVDMVDFAEAFILNSQKYIGEEAFRNIGEQFIDSLHVFEPRSNHYDVIWVQWVTGQLTDVDFVTFLERCKRALRHGGCIVVKDNIASGHSTDFDTEDHSWTRPKDAYLSIFQRARLDVVADRKQTNFPKGIYEVRMFALKPLVNSENHDSS